MKGDASSGYAVSNCCSSKARELLQPLADAPTALAKDCQMYTHHVLHTRY